MALITTIDQIQATGLRLTNMDRAARLPDIELATNEYLLPYLGKGLLDALEANTADPTPDAFLTALLPLVRKPLAAFAYWHELPHMHTRLSDAGVRRTTTDNAPTAYRWEYDEARSYLEERAYITLETLLAYLDANAVDYPLWEDDVAVQALRKSLVMKSGAAFSTCYRLHQPYRSYYYLAPIVLDVERMYLEPLIGKDFLQTFRDRGATDAIEPEEQVALDLMKRAIAQLTIFEASKKLPCTVTASGFMVRNTPGSLETGGGKDGLQQADVQTLQRAADAAYIQGKKQLAALRKYLNETASAIVLADYFTSTYYDAGNTPIVDRGNSTRKIFRW